MLKNIYIILIICSILNSYKNYFGKNKIVNNINPLEFRLIYNFIKFLFSLIIFLFLYLIKQRKLSNYNILVDTNNIKNIFFYIIIVTINNFLFDNYLKNEKNLTNIYIINFIFNLIFSFLIDLYFYKEKFNILKALILFIITCLIIIYNKLL